MQDAVKDTEVLTPPRKKVRDEVEEIPKGVRKAPPTKFPPTMRVCGSASTSEGTTAEENNRFRSSMLQECGRRRLISNSWRLVPPSRMLIRSEDAASIIRLRFSTSPPAKGKAVVLANMVPSAPSKV